MWELKVNCYVSIVGFFLIPLPRISCTVYKTTNISHKKNKIFISSDWLRTTSSWRFVRTTNIETQPSWSKTCQRSSCFFSSNIPNWLIFCSNLFGEYTTKILRFCWNDKAIVAGTAETEELNRIYRVVLPPPRRQRRRRWWWWWWKWSRMSNCGSSSCLGDRGETNSRSAEIISLSLGFRRKWSQIASWSCWSRWSHCSSCPVHGASSWSAMTSGRPRTDSVVSKGSPKNGFSWMAVRGRSFVLCHKEHIYYEQNIYAS